MYNLIRSFLFKFDPEKVHYFSMNILRVICKIPFGKRLLSSIYKPKGNHQYSIFNIQFSNRVGLGAGFDKNATYLNELEALGFGFVEIGTVTPLPQDGNPKPRLFRLPKDKAIINRMGFNNDGMEVVAERLKKWKHRQQTTNNKRLVIGGNIGKNKITPNEDAWLDYEKCFLTLHEYVDYFVVNVSSPNTPGLRELQEKDSLRKILTNLQSLNTKLRHPKPILLKIAPDLTQTQIDDVIDLATEIKLDGLVATNTTISREGLSEDYAVVSREAGGLSGAPVKQRSTEIVQYIHQKTNGQLSIIGSGGILTAEDAKEKIDAGASLVQVWTGFIYTGPAIVKNICKKL
ncbi:quinone-dependent dihydroorotate dehydrogenase [Ferruginibacter lapsinanis]|uniref:quinone-dependent dihydroorotate dehydrogenase n=1 Tax=Ferruginibacter lapsinanis TaxID=563172 RepID=UPI001E4D1648|nr:quinone-dependent dihydroorotate dehydrogenase [Ferruginibacter lapsinanis]UEG50362.1 quinone-dependent dihydroorotate dehydrogenase [Ferruginibacter lapsinanis]